MVGKELPVDPFFRVETLSKTPDPQRLVYQAMHQDYSSGFVADDRHAISESRAGELVVKHLLKGDRGHFGPLEHPQITFNCGGFPHSVIQQARTHRVGVSFDVQSFRYTGDHMKVALDHVSEDLTHDCWWDELGTSGLVGLEGDNSWVEPFIYLRPTGTYTNRQGQAFEYTQLGREIDAQHAAYLVYLYANKIKGGMPAEQARGMLPFDYRQNFVVSFNARSLMHFLDLRAKADAQLEIQQLCDLLMEHFLAWMPEVAAWYRDRRFGKARLSP